MYTDTLHSTPAPNKPSSFDWWFAGWVLAGIQDRKYLDGLPPDQRDKTTKALSDLEQLRHLPEGRARDMALDRLAAYIAREWAPKGRIKTALKERAEIEEKPRAVMKHEAIRYGVFIAHTQLYRVQLVQLGPGRNRAVVVDGVLALGTDDCAGVTCECLSTKPTRPRSAVAAQFMIWHAVANGAKNLVWTAIAGPTRPGDLRVEYRLPWLRRRAIREAESWLLDERLASTTPDPLDDVEAAIRADCLGGYAALDDQRAADRLRDLAEAIRPEEHPHSDALTAVEEPQVDQWAALLEMVTPRKRAILEELCGLVADGLSVPDAKKLVAERRGTSVNALDRFFSRLRKARVVGATSDCQVLVESSG